MTKDTELEKLFSSAITEFPDNDRFMNQLSAQLDKVEYLKRIQQEQKRRLRRNLVLAFASGALAMLAVLLLLPILPSDVQIIESIINTGSNFNLPGKAKVLSTLMIVALSHGLVFSISSTRKYV